MTTRPFLYLTLLLSIQAFGQNNLDFENKHFDFIRKREVATEWQEKYNAPGKHKASLDSVTKYHGNYSFVLESTDSTQNSDAILEIVTIKTNFEGRFLTLSGYIKTENMEGKGGLFMVIQQDGKVVGSDFMQKIKLNKTADWQHCYIVQEIPENADSILLGFQLAGKGKMWVDSLALHIDATPYAIKSKDLKRIYPADSDTATIVVNPFSNSVLKDGKKRNDLFLLGKIWGFLKYYHPAVAGGKYNWDNELFRLLPQYLAVKTKTERNALLLQWINSLGDVSPCISCNDSVLKKASLVPDFTWMRDPSNFSEELITKFNDILHNRFQGRQYYIDVPYSAMEVKHERTYELMDYLPDAHRLLALYRYWNLVEYWYPYKYLIGSNWDEVLKEFIPVVLQAKDKVSYYLSLERLVASIHDSHAIAESKTLNEYYGIWYMPFTLLFVKDKAVVASIVNDSLAQGIHIGDVLESINGMPVSTLVKRLTPNIAASNSAFLFKKLSERMIRSNSRTSALSIQRGNDFHKITVQNQIPKNIYPYYKGLFSYQTDSSYFLIRSEIGYINPGNLKKSDFAKMRALFAGTKAIVLDNRQYPTDDLRNELGAYLLPGRMRVANFTSPELNYPGCFLINNAEADMVGLPGNQDYYRGEVIILVNERTISKGEFYTMLGELSPRAKIVGSTTAGADGSNKRFYLPGGFITSFSGQGVYYPDGKEAQRVGIIPDYEVKLTIKGLKERRDELLEEAIKIIDGFQ